MQSVTEHVNKPFAELTRKEIESIAPQRKQGSKDGTDGAHIASIELVKVILQLNRQNPWVCIGENCYGCILSGGYPVACRDGYEEDNNKPWS
jgi:hypothetical protein